MASVASQLIEEVTAHVQSDSPEDVREICADGTYFPNNLCNKIDFKLLPIRTVATTDEVKRKNCSVIFLWMAKDILNQKIP